MAISKAAQKFLQTEVPEWARDLKRPYFFESKQRMMARAAALGTIEAYRRRFPLIALYGGVDLRTELESAQTVMAKSSNSAGHAGEVRAAFYASALQQISNRQLTTWAVIAAFIGVVTSALVAGLTWLAD